MSNNVSPNTVECNHSTVEFWAIFAREGRNAHLWRTSFINNGILYVEGVQKRCFCASRIDAILLLWAEPCQSLMKNNVLKRRLLWSIRRFIDT